MWEIVLVGGAIVGAGALVVAMFRSYSGGFKRLYAPEHLRCVYDEVAANLSALPCNGEANSVKGLRTQEARVASPSP